MKNKSLIQMVLGTLLALGIAGCSGSGGGGEGLTAYRLKGIEYGLLQPGTLTPTDNAVSGTGTIIFRTPLVDADNNFSFQFTLDAGGSVDLLPNAPRDLNTPVSLSFKRAADNTLQMILTDGSKVTDVTSDLSKSVPADESLSVEVDVHEHGDIIVWIAGMEENWDFGTEIAGNYWGLRLSNATLFAAMAGPAKEEH